MASAGHFLLFGFILYGKPNKKAIVNHAIPSKYLHCKDNDPIPSLMNYSGGIVDYLYDFEDFGGCNINDCVNEMT